MYDLLLKNIARHVSLSQEEEAYIVSHLHTKKIKRKQFLIQEGDVQKHSYFVTAGCLRMYSLDKNGFEHILQFAPLAGGLVICLVL